MTSRKTPSPRETDELLEEIRALELAQSQSRNAAAVARLCETASAPYEGHSSPGDHPGGEFCHCFDPTLPYSIPRDELVTRILDQTGPIQVGAGEAPFRIYQRGFLTAFDEMVWRTFGRRRPPGYTWLQVEQEHARRMRRNQREERRGGT